MSKRMNYESDNRKVRMQDAIHVDHVKSERRTRSQFAATSRQRWKLEQLLGREPDANLSKSDASSLIEKLLREQDAS